MESLVEASAASCGGIVSSATLHPLDTIKTRLQVSRVLARRLLPHPPEPPPPHSPRTPPPSSPVHDTWSQWGHSNHQPPTSAPARPVAASPPCHPTPGFLCKARPDPSKSADGADDDGTDAPPPPPPGVIAVVREIYSDGGVPAFFAGVGVGACQSAIEKGIYFFAYSVRS